MKKLFNLLLVVGIAFSSSLHSASERPPATDSSNHESPDNRPQVPGNRGPDNRDQRSTNTPPSNQPPPELRKALPATILVRQATANKTQINLLVDVRDQTDQRVPEINKDGFTIDIGPYGSTVELLADSSQIDAIAPGFATIFLIDISKSISDASFNRVSNAVRDWVRSMNASDRVAIITFGTQVDVIHDFTGSKDSLLEKIGQIHPKDMHTRLHDGLLRALDFGERRDVDLPLRRGIVLLSDGIDDTADGASSQEVQLRLEHAQLPVFPISFDAGLSAHDKEMGLKVLGSFARASGGELFNAGRDQFEATYEKVHLKAADGRLLRVVCKECPSDGRVYPIQISYQENSRIVTGQGHVRMSTGPADNSSTDTIQTDNPFPWLSRILPPFLKDYVKAVGVLLVIFLISPFALLLYKRLTRPTESISPNASPMDESVSTFEESTDGYDVISAAKRVEKVDGINVVSAPGIQLRLTVVKGQEVGKSWGFVLHERIQVGRSSGCDISIQDDPEISGKHFSLMLKDGQLFVVDSGSTNGTTVNGVAIMTPFKTQEFDLIGLGRTVLRLSRA